MREIFRLYELHKAIVSNRDIKFTSKFLKSLLVDLGTQLNFSITYHSQTNKHTERVNQVIEDTLHMYAMDKPSMWEDYLHLIEFSYNNGNRTSLKMNQFEAMAEDARH